MKHEKLRIHRILSGTAKAVGDIQLSPSREVQVYGMRRSGNHAVINWLLRNAPTEGAVFFNNCKPNRNPLSHHASIEVFWKGAKLPRRRTAAVSNDLLSAAGQAPLAIMSYEDVMPKSDDPRRAAIPLNGQNLIVYRAFLNWSASLLSKLQRNSDQGPIWRLGVMCRACKTYSKALDLVAGHERAILYDRWVADAGYREAFLLDLGFSCRDNSLGEVQRYGGGSSFQPDTKDASALNTLTRFDEMSQDLEYRRFLDVVAADEGFVTRLFNHFPQDAQWLRRQPNLGGLRLARRPKA